MVGVGYALIVRRYLFGMCDLIWEKPAYCYFRENRDKAMFL